LVDDGDLHWMSGIDRSSRRRTAPALGIPHPSVTAASNLRQTGAKPEANIRVSDVGPREPIEIPHVTDRERDVGLAHPSEPRDADVPLRTQLVGRQSDEEITRHLSLENRDTESTARRPVVEREVDAARAVDER